MSDCKELAALLERLAERTKTVSASVMRDAASVLRQQSDTIVELKETVSHLESELSRTNRDKQAD